MIENAEMSDMEIMRDYYKSNTFLRVGEQYINLDNVANIYREGNTVFFNMISNRYITIDLKNSNDNDYETAKLFFAKLMKLVMKGAKP